MTAPWPPGGPAAKTRLAVHVTPGARKNGLEWTGPLSLKVKLSAPPVEGKANEALLGFLAEELAVRPRQIALVRGSHSREKTLEVSPP